MIVTAGSPHLSAAAHNPNKIGPIEETSQERFCAIDNCFEILYHGTRGPGKTFSLLMCFAARVGLGYGAAWRGIIFRRTFPELRDIIEKSEAMFRVNFGNAARYNKSTHTWTWASGEQLIFDHFEREGDYWKYHGHEYPFIGWEELTTHADLGGYRRMMSCCRAAKRIFPNVKDPLTGAVIPMPLMVRATTNPYGVGHNKVKNRFRLPAQSDISWMAPVDENDPKSPVMERLAIQGSLRENTILLASDPDYPSRIAAAAKNEGEKRAWLFGDWEITSGGMFDDVWDTNVHALDPFDVPKEWRIDRSFDWGSSKPFSVGWWAESNGEDVRLKNGKTMSTVRGDLYRINEWYGWTGKDDEGSKMTSAEIAAGIVERELGWKIHDRVKKGVADSSIFDNEDNTSVAAKMAAPVTVNGRRYPGVKWEPCVKGPGSRKIGWEAVRTMLQDAKRPKTGPRERPGLFVFKTCAQFLRTVPGISRDEKDPDDVNTKAEDHIADEVRYRVRYKPARIGSGGTRG